MNPQDQMLVLFREHVAGLLLGTVFVFVGLTACCVAAARRRSEFRLLVWFGIFIGMAGFRLCAEANSTLHLFPQSPWPARIVIAVDYLVVIPALLFWTELCTGIVRRAIQLLTVLAVALAALGLGWFAITGYPYKFLRYSSLLAICSMLLVGVLVGVPRVANKYLLVDSRVVRIVMPALALSLSMSM